MGSHKLGPSDRLGSRSNLLEAWCALPEFISLHILSMERHLRLHIKIYLTPGHNHHHLQSPLQDTHTPISCLRRRPHIPDLDSRRMSPLCHCETRVHHHLGSRVRLVGRTGRSRVIASSRRDQRSKRFSVPSYSLRLAFALRDTISVWDAKAAKFLLNSRLTLSVQNISSQSSFFPDGRFFACVTDNDGVHVWKESPVGYTLHQKLAFAGNGLLFSQAGNQFSRTTFRQVVYGTRKIKSFRQIIDPPSSWNFPQIRHWQHSHGTGETQLQLLTSSLVIRG